MKDKYLVWGMGTGLVLYAVHNKLQPGLDLGIFLPQIGLAITVVCSICILVRGKIDFGPKWLWIPMLVMVASMPLSWVFNDGEIGMIMGSAAMGSALFIFYLAARKAGINLFAVFVPFVIIQAISVIAYGIAMPGINAGGIITSPPMDGMTANYDIAAGFLMFGTVIAGFRRQWLLVALTLVALFFTGAGEAVFVVGVLGVMVLVRRDWSRKLVYAVVPVILVALLWTGLGYTQQLYKPTIDLAKGTYDKFTGNDEVIFVCDGVLPEGIGINEGLIWLESEWQYKESLYGQGWENIGGRLRIIEQALRDVRLFGHGYKPGIAEETTVHNIPVIIIDQIGPLAALAWLFIVVMLLLKTKWKYAWVAVVALGVFDHFLWTQISPYAWCLMGVSSSTMLRNDYIFKED